MTIKFKHSTITLILLILLNIITISFLVLNCKKSNYDEREHLLKYFEAQISFTLETTFYNVELLEAVIELGYDDFDVSDLDILISPIVDQYGVRNVSILPDGIVEYVYPLEGNQKAIGDNIYEMPARKVEATISIETKDTILSGPYELTQGGTGLIARKAIFSPCENGTDELWGMVAIVMDTTAFLSHLDLDSIVKLGYDYELSSDVNGLGKNIIQSSEDYKNHKDNSIYIDLPNGNWQLNIIKKIEVSQVVTFLSIFIVGLFLSFMIFIYVRKNEDLIASINKEAYNDNLTGLYNRKMLDVIKHKPSDNGNHCTIFYIDLNDFKLANDLYGHDIGDKLLIALSERMKKIIREQDLLIRVGGDEFVVILENTSCKETISNFCSRLDNVQVENFIFDQIKITSRLSYGYACFPSEGNTMDEVLKLADKRMYEHKRRRK